MSLESISTRPDRLVGKYAVVYQRVIVAASFFFVLSIALSHFSYPKAVFQNGSSDHISHIGATLLFLHSGIDVYRHPVEDLLTHDPGDQQFARQNEIDPDSLFLDPLNPNSPPIEVNWRQFIRPYPPGLYVIYFPLAMAYHFRLIGYLWACRTVILVLLLVSAGITDVVFGFAFESADLWSLFIRLFTATLISYWSYYWALLGFFDVIALLLVLMSLCMLNYRRWDRTLFYYSMAIFVHSRMLYASPIALIALANAWNDPAHTLKRWVRQPTLWISLAATLICLSSVIIAMPHVKIMLMNNIYMHFSGRVLHLVFPMILGIVLALISVLGMLFVRDIGGALMVICPWVFMLQTPEVRLWHSLAWLPLILYCSRDVRTLGHRLLWLNTTAMVCFIAFLVYGIDFWLFT